MGRAQLAVVAVLMLAASAARGRPHAKRTADVPVTASARERYALVLWLRPHPIKTAQEQDDYISIRDELALDEARGFLAKHPETDLDKVEDVPKPYAMGRAELKTLIAWLTPTSDVPMAAGLSEILGPLREDMQSALDGGKK